MKSEIVIGTALHNAIHGRYALLTYAEALKIAQEWSQRLPMKYDVIVGVPRTGLTIACFLSDLLGVPLSTPDTYPRSWIGRTMPKREVKSALIVEDSTYSGSHLLPAAQKVWESGVRTVHLGSLIRNPQGLELDTWGCELASNRDWILEWEILNLPAERLACDLDGVLCNEWHPLHNDDAFIQDWIMNVPPFMIPTHGVDSIVTSRPEKWRYRTENWLSEHDVRYSRLLMNPTPKSVPDNFISSKIAALEACKPKLFIESRFDIARAVHYKTGIPTLSIEKMTLFD